MAVSDSNAVGIDDSASPNGGVQYLDMGFGSGTGDTSATSADVDVAGCSPYGLATWDAAGFYQTFGFGTPDVADFEVSFDVGPTSITSNLINQDTWMEVTDDGNIAAGATVANVTVGGLGIPVGIDDKASVFWDDVTFDADCVVAFSKISGKIGERRGTHSFGGVFGLLESGTEVGTIDVNYKVLKVNCTFTPTSLGIAEELFAVWRTTYECSNTDAGTAFVGIGQGSGGPEGPDKLKVRGTININGATKGDYNIDGSGPGGSVYLDKGNTHIGYPLGLPLP